jgi:hypothetical protein
MVDYADPLGIINARIIHEAQRELIYTGNSIKQLADFSENTRV